jgi:hypothetical protein
MKSEFLSRGFAVMNPKFDDAMPAVDPICDWRTTGFKITVCGGRNRRAPDSAIEAGAGKRA